MKKIVIGIVVLAIGVVSLLSFGNGRATEAVTRNSSDYEILKKWDLPKELNEISGISWIGGNRIACVQDEDGIIFIYNLETSKIENAVSFGSGGDYEGISVIGNDAYVLRSDGVIFEINNFQDKNLKVQKHDTSLQKLKGINIEGLSPDPGKNQLLLAIKERKEHSNRKEVYAFDLNTKTTGDEPLFIVELSDPIFSNVKGKLKNKFSPGEIAVHPQTGEIYILDGTNPKILITGKDGSLKDLVMLNAGDFGNPEGLTFTPQGDMYISNEAEGGPANILKVSLNK